MKLEKTVLMTAVLFVVSCLCLWAFEVGFGADALSVQDLLTKTGSYQVNADIRCSIKNDFELRLPVTFSFNMERYFLDSGIDVVYYPFEKGLFFGLSIFKMGTFLSENMASVSYYNLNEIILGWTFNLPYGFGIEPSIVVRDPSGTYSDEYSELRGFFPCYRTYRFRLQLLWKYNSENN